MWLDKEIRKGELIGKIAMIVESKNRDNIGIRGKIIDETKNTLVIMHEKRKKSIMKAGNVFKIKWGDIKVMVKGRAFLGRPEDRIKSR